MPRATTTGYKWAAGRSPAPLLAQFIDRTASAGKALYWLCAEAGICVLCKRVWAKEGRRMCAKCANDTRARQDYYRNGLRSQLQKRRAGTDD